MVTVSKAAVLRIIFDSVGRPATEIYQKVRELPGVDSWRPAEEKPPVEKEERDEDGNLSRVSIPVLGCCRDGSRKIVRRIDEEAAETGGYEWHGWVREPDDGCAEDVAWWMELPKGPEEA